MTGAELRAGRPLAGRPTPLTIGRNETMTTGKTLLDFFEEVAAYNRAQADRDDADSAYQARKEARRKRELEKDIRLGVRDANGDWIEQPETDEEEDEENENDGD